MSLAALTRFAPLISLASKPVIQLSDANLLEAANAISAGQSPEVWVDLFKTIRASEPDTVVGDLLSSPTVLKLLQGVGERQNQAIEEESQQIFCRCPFCAKSFEISLQPQ